MHKSAKMNLFIMRGADICQWLLSQGPEAILAKKQLAKKLLFPMKESERNELFWKIADESKESTT